MEELLLKLTHIDHKYNIEFEKSVSPSHYQYCYDKFNGKKGFSINGSFYTTNWMKRFNDWNINKEDKIIAFMTC